MKMKHLPTALFCAILALLWAIPAYAIDNLEYPKFQALDGNGDPCSGCKVYTYEPGTSTAKGTYADYNGNAANTNPVILDSRGEADIFLDGTYKIILKDSDDTTIWTLDNVRGSAQHFESGNTGYIAILSGASAVYGAATISGASITETSTIQSGVSTIYDISGGIREVKYLSGNTDLAPIYMIAQLISPSNSSGASIQLAGVTPYENGYVAIRGRGGVSIWGVGCAADSSEGMKFHSDYGSATTGIWIPIGDYDSKLVIKWTRDASGASVYGEVWAISGTWYTATGGTL